jgi:hypothetical protein
LSSAAAAAAVGERLEGMRQSLKLPPVAWLDAVSAALRGDVEGTLAALEGKGAEQTGAGPSATTSRTTATVGGAGLPRPPAMTLAATIDGKLGQEGSG